MQSEYLQGQNDDFGCDEDPKAWKGYFIHSFPSFKEAVDHSFVHSNHVNMHTFITRGQVIM